ncbi:UDP-N-acetylmuramyl-tripeptide synthetase [Bombiscardovia nodaiensis]|uniref:UDP-N-acetylmuramyl-tripeptide synthetase n=1 Tax=Bombiscardovia nodaiensis TaxID=2932181 RepID=A0ABM8B8J0_9BIFI|nr:UDP-N-acetylmuramyl-tripeptide synthetase [Bombiscardovia nodaiensis]
MTLSLPTVLSVLRDHQLLREVVSADGWTIDPRALSPALRKQAFTSLTYDSRSVKAGSLLFCKGHFQTRFLESVDAAGLGAYVAESDYSAYTQATGIIVNDVRKAMSLISALFYGRPQDQLKVVGITGTKGKTTTAYFVQALLGAASGGKAALLSSVDNCLDGKTYVESQLTTPESLDLFRMMRQAVDAGMRYLVMEVSSQAYKVDRVYGLTFDLGAFLNISPDHISPIEHPTFEDYLYCKRQITYNSRQMVVGAEHAYFSLIEQDARLAQVPLTTFALDTGEGVRADWVACALPTEADQSSYELLEHGQRLGQLHLAMEGSFNGANAAAACAIVSALGLSIDGDSLSTLAQVRIAGRMEGFEGPGIAAYVDYAHNYTSTAAVLDFAHHKYADRSPYVTLVTGSAGGKAVDRRQEIVQAAQTRVNRLIFTEEDTENQTDDTASICQEMLSYVTNPGLDASIVLDRTQAITSAVEAAQAHPDRFDVIVVIGKGNERWIKRAGQHVPYEGDDQVIARLLGASSKKEQA